MVPSNLNSTYLYIGCKYVFIRLNISKYMNIISNIFFTFLATKILFI